jgi:type II secretory pathway pseudopilin PulG
MFHINEKTPLTGMYRGGLSNPTAITIVAVVLILIMIGLLLIIMYVLPPETNEKTNQSESETRLTTADNIQNKVTDQSSPPQQSQEILSTTIEQKPANGNLGGVIGDQATPPNANDPIEITKVDIVQSLPNVKIIEIIRDSSNQTEKIYDDAGVIQRIDNSDWRTIQIGEVIVTDVNNHKLDASAYEKVYFSETSDGSWTKLFPPSHAVDGDLKTFAHTTGSNPVHQLTLVLKQPTRIKKIEVYNRAECCQYRLRGAIMLLKNENGVVLKELPLNPILLNVFNRW